MNSGTRKALSLLLCLCLLAGLAPAALAAEEAGDPPGTEETATAAPEAEEAAAATAPEDETTDLPAETVEEAPVLPEGSLPEQASEALPAAAEGGSGTCGERVFFEIDGSTLRIYGEGPMDDCTDGVNSIGLPNIVRPGWWRWRDTITELIIEEGVTHIGDTVFTGLDHITEVTIPSTVTSIAEWAFTQDASLRKVTILGQVTTLGGYVFYRCASLSEVVLPEGMKTIGSNAFASCPSLTEIAFPSSLEAINSNAFSGSGLQNLRLPAGLKTIGASAFAASSLESLTLPAGITSLGTGAFSDCEELVSVELSDGLSVLGTNLFSGCTALKSLCVPDGIAMIPYSFCSGCSNLESIRLPLSLTGVDRYAFNGCGSLSRVEYPGTDAQWDAVNIAENNQPLLDAVAVQRGSYARQGTWGNFTWTLSDQGVLTLSGSGAMPDEQGPWTAAAVKKLVVQPGATAIGKNNFTHHGLLTAAELPDTVKTIGDYAFNTCTKLSAVRMPSAVTGIGLYAFAYCESLKEIVLPSTLTGTMTGSFQHSGLVKVSVPAGVAPVSTFSGCTALTQVTLADGMTKIDSDAFSGCTALKSIRIPASVKTIGYRSFERCTALTTVEMQEGLNYIAGEAFLYCSSLTDLQLPDSIIEISFYAFMGCKSLTDLSMPASLETLGVEAFYGCGLDTVRFQGSFPDIRYDDAHWDMRYPFDGENATAYYPAGDETWTAEARALLGEDLIWVILCPGHVPQIVPAVPATCTETGLSEGSVCALCGETLTEQQLIPTVPHQYENGFCTVCGQAEPAVVSPGDGKTLEELAEGQDDPVDPSSLHSGEMSYDGNGNGSFSSFEGLLALIDRYDQVRGSFGAFLTYTGTDPLVIRQDITIPEDMFVYSFTGTGCGVVVVPEGQVLRVRGHFNADSLTLNGSCVVYDDNGSVYANTLTNNGILYLTGANSTGGVDEDGGVYQGGGALCVRSGPDDLDPERLWGLSPERFEDRYAEAEGVHVLTLKPASGGTLLAVVNGPGEGDITAALYEGSLTDADVLAGSGSPVAADTISSGKTLTLADLPAGEYKLLLTQKGKTAPRIVAVSAQGDTDLGTVSLWLYGDVDHNGKVQALDVLYLQLFIGSHAGPIMDLPQADRSYAQQVADVDRSGAVNAMDVLYLQLYIGSRSGPMADLA